MVFCATSQDLVMSVSVRRVQVVFSTAAFKSGGKSCPKTRETVTLWRGIQKAPRNKLGLNPSHCCTSTQFVPTELTECPMEEAVKSICQYWSNTFTYNLYTLIWPHYMAHLPVPIGGITNTYSVSSEPGDQEVISGDYKLIKNLFRWNNKSH